MVAVPAWCRFPFLKRGPVSGPCLKQGPFSPVCRPLSNEGLVRTTPENGFPIETRRVTLQTPWAPHASQTSSGYPTFSQAHRGGAADAGEGAGGSAHLPTLSGGVREFPLLGVLKAMLGVPKARHQQSEGNPEGSNLETKRGVLKA